MSVLVTGGAGYIGSHVVHALRAAGKEAVVVDDLSSGHRDALPKDVPFLEASVGDRDRVTNFIREHDVDAVMHFAGRIEVGESVVDPRRYFTGNLAASIAFLETVLDAKIRSFVFSSTAAVYGNPETTPIDETHPTRPINSYGVTKLAIEDILGDYERAYGLRRAALRYFNAAGASPALGLGERHRPESHLVPIVLQVALGQRPHLVIHGDDYDTPDGTCVRDFIHVGDLASAHLAALDHLERDGEGGAFNLGAGVGTSVREVVEVARKVTGHPIPVVIGPRREGDAPFLVASAARALRAFEFRAQNSSLERIVRDAWEFATATRPSKFRAR